MLLCCFSVFVSCDQSLSKKEIAIQPFGEIEETALQEIQYAVKTVYDKNAVILPPTKLPESAYINSKSPRYRADSLIRFLKKSKPDTIDIILGFTAMDISTTKKNNNGTIKKPESRYQDWGVFGLGYCPGASCIVSDFRIGNTSEKNKTERIKKICIHEIGHNLGLPHCPNKKCVMTDACESIKTVDNVKLTLCEKCKSKI